MVNYKFKTFSINLNAQHLNGMTPFDSAARMYGYGSKFVWTPCRLFFFKGNFLVDLKKKLEAGDLLCFLCS